jgi:hypothetical protein
VKQLNFILKVCASQHDESLSASQGKHMDTKFAVLVETLAPKFQRLIEMEALKYGGLPCDMPASGVYLFSENGWHLYVGRSNVLRKRHGRHCRPGATHKQAAFAFQLAREMTGRTKASYRAGDDSRDGLMKNSAFAAAFVSAKERIRAMDYRYMVESDQNRQALLEIYCAVVLATPYNDFGTH